MGQCSFRSILLCMCTLWHDIFMYGVVDEDRAAFDPRCWSHNRRAWQRIEGVLVNQACKFPE